jgi:hypothetical protein
VAETEYEGWNVAIGTNLAVGWRQFFFTVPISYAWSEVDILKQTVTALNIGPRVGAHGDFGKFGGLAVYVGATYLKADVDLADSVKFDTSGSGIDGVEDVTVIDFEIHQRNKDRWNMLAGFNWDVNKSISLHFEAGFLGSRTNAIGSLTFRF